MTDRTTALVAAVMLASGLAFGGPAAHAQTDAAPMQGQTQTEFEDEMLQSYADASVELRRISQDWAGRMAEAEDAQALVEMQTEAETEMIGAVEGEGLTAEQYNEITRAAQADPALAEQLSQMIIEAEEGG